MARELFFDIPRVIWNCRAHHTQLILNLNAELSDSLDKNVFIMLLMTIDGKQQTGYQPCKDLDHQAMFTPGDQMIHRQAPFPPGEEVFDIPSKLIGRRHLSGRKVVPSRCDPVSYVIDFISELLLSGRTAPY